MSSKPLRFVHASDLHLERPPTGIAQVPEHLRELFIECAYWAAERVFEVALAEEVDFLVLSGDVLEAQQTGPRGPLFLAEQFERLAERGTRVYWAGGRVDPPEAWPDCVPLPDNVHLFAENCVTRCTHEREGESLAVVAGASRQHGQPVRLDDFAPDPSGLFTLAVVHGSAEAEALRSRGVNYWALGGSHARKTLFSGAPTAHYPGSPQGREPAQVGPHGCTLVQLDPQRQIRTTLVPADVLRWHSERLAVTSATTRKDLETRLQDRVQAIRQANPGTDLFLSWTVSGEGRILGQLRRGTLAVELLEALRSEHGFASPCAWSLSITAEPMPLLPTAWLEQQTILGDFLRELGEYEASPERPVALDAYLAEQHRAGPLADAATIAAGPQRERLLREAAMLGVDLLSGEDAEP